MTYKTEFPSFGEMDVEIPQGFEDSSWHNDVSPSFTKGIAEGGKFVLFIDFKDPSRRELLDLPRFNLLTYSQDDYYVDGFGTDDWAKMLEHTANKT